MSFRANRDKHFADGMGQGAASDADASGRAYPAGHAGDGDAGASGSIQDAADGGAGSGGLVHHAADGGAGSGGLVHDAAVGGAGAAEPTAGEPGKIRAELGRPTSLLADIARRAEEIRGRSGEFESRRGLPEDVLQWVYDLRLFKLMVPEEFGGRPTPFPDILRAFDELSALDGSLGWLVHIGAAAAFFVPCFDKETSRQLFSPREAVIAGTGFPGGRAEPVAGGYRVTGRWSFTSGAQYATIFTAGARFGQSGPETVRAFAFLREQVRIEADWDAFGLKATASDTYSVEDEFVPHERVFTVGEALWIPDDPIYRLSFDMLAVACIASVCLGLVRRFVELASATPRWESLQEQQRVAAELARRRELFYVLAERWWSRIVADERPPKAEEQTILWQIRRLVNESVAAVHRVFPYLGMSALWESNDVNRVYRDLQTAAQHVYLRE